MIFDRILRGDRADDDLVYGPMPLAEALADRVPALGGDRRLHRLQPHALEIGPVGRDRRVPFRLLLQAVAPPPAERAADVRGELRRVPARGGPAPPPAPRPGGRRLPGAP